MTEPETLPPAGKRLLACLAGQVLDPPPVWLMRQAGRYLPEYRELRAKAGSFLDLCYSPKLAIEVTLQPIRRYGFDAAILFSDILVVPQAMGVNLAFLEGEGPRLEPVRERRAIEALDAGPLRQRLAPVYETVAGLKAALPPDVTLIGFAGAPWTLAAYMVQGGGSRDFKALSAFADADPEAFELLLDRLVEAVIDHLAAQIEAGAEVVQLFDSWAGLIPEDRLEAWCMAPARRIRERLRALHPAVPLIFFPRGIENLEALASVALGSTAEGISFGTAVPMDWAARTIGGQGRCLQGNLDPEALLGPEAAMFEAVDALRQAVAGKPHIFNLGHGVIKETAPERVQSLLRYLKSSPA